MKLESKFDINNLVQHKFDNRDSDTITCLEIMEVRTETCYAGTQVFYHTRNIVAMKKYKHDYKKEGEFIWEIGHSIDKYGNKNISWEKYREDELIACSQENIDIILCK